MSTQQRRRLLLNSQSDNGAKARADEHGAALAFVPAGLIDRIQLLVAS
ncbi:MAG TPA: hypothetical protein VHB50_17165 [Bryobacteraceae bacterium]|nr:hypothetical protein [Bryobacteraceae bacterium]